LSQQAPSPEAAESTPGTRARKIGGSGASSVFSLFNLKAKSKFWTESVIRTGPLPLISFSFYNRRLGIPVRFLRSAVNSTFTGCSFCRVR